MSAHRPLPLRSFPLWLLLRHRRLPPPPSHGAENESYCTAAHRTGLRTNLIVQRGSNQAMFDFPCRGLIQEEARSATLK
eukprot:COSAG01_NODE_45028_length_413_cov_1.015924_1_plen_78_part_01